MRLARLNPQLVRMPVALLCGAVIVYAQQVMAIEPEEVSFRAVAAVAKLDEYQYPVCTDQIQIDRGCSQYSVPALNSEFLELGVGALSVLADAVQKDTRPLKREPGYRAADAALYLAGVIISANNGACAPFVEQECLPDAAPFDTTIRPKPLDSSAPSNGREKDREKRNRVGEQIRRIAAKLPFSSYESCLEYALALKELSLEWRIGTLSSLRGDLIPLSSYLRAVNLALDEYLEKRLYLQDRQKLDKILFPLNNIVRTVSQLSAAEARALTDRILAMLQTITASSDGVSPTVSLLRLADTAIPISSHARDATTLAWYGALLARNYVAATIKSAPSPHAVPVALLEPLLAGGDAGLAELRRLVSEHKLWSAKVEESTPFLLQFDYLFSLASLTSFRSELVKALRDETEVEQSANARLEYIPTSSVGYPFFQINLLTGKNQFFTFQILNPVNSNEFSAEELAAARLISNYDRQKTPKPPRELSWGDLVAYQLTYFAPQLGHFEPYAPKSLRRARREEIAGRLLNGEKLRFYSPYLTEQCEQKLQILRCEDLLSREDWPKPQMPTATTPQSAGFSQSPSPIPSLGGMISAEMARKAGRVAEVLERVEVQKTGGDWSGAERELLEALKDEAELGANSVNLRGQLLLVYEHEQNWEAAYRELETLWKQLAEHFDISSISVNWAELALLYKQGRKETAVKRGIQALTEGFNPRD